MLIRYWETFKGVMSLLLYSFAFCLVRDFVSWAFCIQFGFINRIGDVHWSPLRVSKANVSSVSSIRSDEGLTLETSAVETLSGDQFTLIT